MGWDDGDGELDFFAWEVCTTGWLEGGGGFWRRMCVFM